MQLDIQIHLVAVMHWQGLRGECVPVSRQAGMRQLRREKARLKENCRNSRLSASMCREMGSSMRLPAAIAANLSSPQALILDS